MPEQAHEVEVTMTVVKRFTVMASDPWEAIDKITQNPEAYEPHTVTEDTTDIAVVEDTISVD